MQGIQKIEGFVLKKKTLLENDYLVILFTKEKGKISTIAKGARAFKSRRSAHLQTGNLIKARIRAFHDVLYIQSTDLVSAFSSARTQEKMDTIYQFFYIIDKMLPELQQEESVYRTVLKFFIQLSKEDSIPAEVFQDALQALLIHLGYINEYKSLHELIEVVENNIDEKLPRHVIM